MKHSSSYLNKKQLFWLCDRLWSHPKKVVRHYNGV